MWYLIAFRYIMRVHKSNPFDVSLLAGDFEIGRLDALCLYNSSAVSGKRIFSLKFSNISRAVAAICFVVTMS